MGIFKHWHEPHHLLGLVIGTVGVLTGVGLFAYSYRWFETSVGGGVNLGELGGIAFLSALVIGGFLMVAAAVYKEPA